MKSQLYRGLGNHYFPQSFFNELYNLADQITKMLTGLITYLTERILKGRSLKKENSSPGTTTNHKPLLSLIFAFNLSLT